MNNLLRGFLLAAIATVSLNTSMLLAQNKLKIFISADMEGVVGVVTGEQLGPKGFEYNRFREFMTQEVNAAITAAFEAGATEVLVEVSKFLQFMGRYRIDLAP